MKTFVEWLAAAGLPTPPNNHDGNWYIANGYPMIVECAECGSTHLLAGSMLDDEGYCYCQSCASVFN